MSVFSLIYLKNLVSWLLVCVRTHHQTKSHIDLLLFSKMFIFLNWIVVSVAKFVFMLLSFRMVFNQLFPGRVLSRVLEIFGSISVWVSSLSAHSRAASGWALWGLRAWGCPLFPGGSFVSSGPSGLGLWGHGAASRLRGAGLPLCPPAGRRCNRRKWGWSRRFLCPAERWPEVHLRALGGEGGGVGRIPCANGGFSVWFLFDGLEDDLHGCSSE